MKISEIFDTIADGASDLWARRAFESKQKAKEGFAAAKEAVQEIPERISEGVQRGREIIAEDGVNLRSIGEASLEFLDTTGDVIGAGADAVGEAASGISQSIVSAGTFLQDKIEFGDSAVANISEGALKGIVGLGSVLGEGAVDIIGAPARLIGGATDVSNNIEAELGGLSGIVSTLNDHIRNPEKEGNFVTDLVEAAGGVGEIYNEIGEPLLDATIAKVTGKPAVSGIKSFFNATKDDAVDVVKTIAKNKSATKGVADKIEDVAKAKTKIGGDIVNGGKKTGSGVGLFFTKAKNGAAATVEFASNLYTAGDIVAKLGGKAVGVTAGLGAGVLAKGATRIFGKNISDKAFQATKDGVGGVAEYLGQYAFSPQARAPLVSAAASSVIDGEVEEKAKQFNTQFGTSFKNHLDFGEFQKGYLRALAAYDTALPNDKANRQRELVSYANEGIRIAGGGVKINNLKDLEDVTDAVTGYSTAVKSILAGVGLYDYAQNRNNPFLRLFDLDQQQQSYDRRFGNLDSEYKKIVAELAGVEVSDVPNISTEQYDKLVYSNDEETTKQALQEVVDGISQTPKVSPKGIGSTFVDESTERAQENQIKALENAVNQEKNSFTSNLEKGLGYLTDEQRSNYEDKSGRVIHGGVNKLVDTYSVILGNIDQDIEDMKEIDSENSREALKVLAEARANMLLQYSQRFDHLLDNNNQNARETVGSIGVGLNNLYDRKATGLVYKAKTDFGVERFLGSVISGLKDITLPVDKRDEQDNFWNPERFTLEDRTFTESLVNSLSQNKEELLVLGGIELLGKGTGKVFGKAGGVVERATDKRVAGTALGKGIGEFAQEFVSETGQELIESAISGSPLGVDGAIEIGLVTSILGTASGLRVNTTHRTNDIGDISSDKFLKGTVRAIESSGNKLLEGFSDEDKNILVAETITNLRELARENSVAVDQIFQRSFIYDSLQAATSSIVDSRNSIINEALVPAESGLTYDQYIASQPGEDGNKIGVSETTYNQLTALALGQKPAIQVSLTPAANVQMSQLIKETRANTTKFINENISRISSGEGNTQRRLDTFKPTVNGVSTGLRVQDVEASSLVEAFGDEISVGDNRRKVDFNNKEDVINWIQNEVNLPKEHKAQLLASVRTDALPGDTRALVGSSLTSPIDFLYNAARVGKKINRWARNKAGEPYYKGISDIKLGTIFDNVGYFRDTTRERLSVMDDINYGMFIKGPFNSFEEISRDKGTVDLSQTQEITDIDPETSESKSYGVFIPGTTLMYLYRAENDTANSILEDVEHRKMHEKRINKEIQDYYLMLNIEQATINKNSGIAKVDIGMGKFSPSFVYRQRLIRSYGVDPQNFIPDFYTAQDGSSLKGDAGFVVFKITGDLEKDKALNSLINKFRYESVQTQLGGEKKTIQEYYQDYLDLVPEEERNEDTYVQLFKTANSPEKSSALDQVPDRTSTKAAIIQYMIVDSLKKGGYPDKRMLDALELYKVFQNAVYTNKDGILRKKGEVDIAGDISDISSEDSQQIFDIVMSMASTGWEPALRILSYNTHNRRSVITQLEKAKNGAYMGETLSGKEKGKNVFKYNPYNPDIRSNDTDRDALIDYGKFISLNPGIPDTAGRLSGMVNAGTQRYKNILFRMGNTRPTGQSKSTTKETKIKIEELISEQIEVGAKDIMIERYEYEVLVRLYEQAQIEKDSLQTPTHNEKYILARIATLDMPIYVTDLVYSEGRGTYTAYDLSPRIERLTQGSAQLTEGAKKRVEGDIQDSRSNARFDNLSELDAGEIAKKIKNVDPELFLKTEEVRDELLDLYKKFGYNISLQSVNADYLDTLISNNKKRYNHSDRMLTVYNQAVKDLQSRKDNLSSLPIDQVDGFGRISIQEVIQRIGFKDKSLANEVIRDLRDSGELLFQQKDRSLDELIDFFEKRAALHSSQIRTLERQLNENLIRGADGARGYYTRNQYKSKSFSDISPLIRIFDTDSESTFIHEFSHHLNNFLPQKEQNEVDKIYDREFKKKIDELYDRLKDVEYDDFSNMTNDEKLSFRGDENINPTKKKITRNDIEKIVTRDFDYFTKSSTLLFRGEEYEITGSLLQTLKNQLEGEDLYRYSNVSEFFAEEMTDAFDRRASFKREGFFRKIVLNAVDFVKSLLGYKQSTFNGLIKDYIKGRFNEENLVLRNLGVLDSREGFGEKLQEDIKSLIIKDMINGNNPGTQEELENNQLYTDYYDKSYTARLSAEAQQPIEEYLAFYAFRERLRIAYGIPQLAYDFNYGNYGPENRFILDELFKSQGVKTVSALKGKFVNMDIEEVNTILEQSKKDGAKVFDKEKKNAKDESFIFENTLFNKESGKGTRKAIVVKEDEVPDGYIPVYTRSSIKGGTNMPLFAVKDGGKYIIHAPLYLFEGDVYTKLPEKYKDKLNTALGRDLEVSSVGTIPRILFNGDRFDASLARAYLEAQAILDLNVYPESGGNYWTFVQDIIQNEQFASTISGYIPTINGDIASIREAINTAISLNPDIGLHIQELAKSIAIQEANKLSLFKNDELTLEQMKLNVTVSLKDAVNTVAEEISGRGSFDDEGISDTVATIEDKLTEEEQADMLNGIELVMPHLAEEIAKRLNAVSITRDGIEARLREEEAENQLRVIEENSGVQNMNIAQSFVDKVLGTNKSDIINTIPLMENFYNFMRQVASEKFVITDGQGNVLGEKTINGWFQDIIGMMSDFSKSNKDLSNPEGEFTQRMTDEIRTFYKTGRTVDEFSEISSGLSNQSKIYLGIIDQLGKIPSARSIEGSSLSTASIPHAIRDLIVGDAKGFGGIIGRIMSSRPAQGPTDSEGNTIGDVEQEFIQGITPDMLKNAFYHSIGGQTVTPFHLLRTLNPGGFHDTFFGKQRIPAGHFSQVYDKPSGKINRFNWIFQNTSEIKESDIDKFINTEMVGQDDEGYDQTESMIKGEWARDIAAAYLNRGFAGSFRASLAIGTSQLATAIRYSTLGGIWNLGRESIRSGIKSGVLDTITKSRQANSHMWMFVSYAVGTGANITTALFTQFLPNYIKYLSNRQTTPKYFSNDQYQQIKEETGFVVDAIGAISQLSQGPQNFLFDELMRGPIVDIAIDAWFEDTGMTFDEMLGADGKLRDDVKANLIRGVNRRFQSIFGVPYDASLNSRNVGLFRRIINPLSSRGVGQVRNFIGNVSGSIFRGRGRTATKFVGDIETGNFNGAQAHLYMNAETNKFIESFVRSLVYGRRFCELKQAAFEGAYGYSDEESDRALDNASCFGFWNFPLLEFDGLNSTVLIQNMGRVLGALGTDFSDDENGSKLGFALRQITRAYSKSINKSFFIPQIANTGILQAIIDDDFPTFIRILGNDLSYRRGSLANFFADEQLGKLQQAAYIDRTRPRWYQMDSGFSNLMYHNKQIGQYLGDNDTKFSATLTTLYNLPLIGSFLKFGANQTFDEDQEVYPYLDLISKDEILDVITNNSEFLQVGELINGRVPDNITTEEKQFLYGLIKRRGSVNTNKANIEDRVQFNFTDKGERRLYNTDKSAVDVANLYMKEALGEDGYNTFIGGFVDINRDRPYDDLQKKILQDAVAKYEHNVPGSGIAVLGAVAVLTENELAKQAGHWGAADPDYYNGPDQARIQSIVADEYGDYLHDVNPYLRGEFANFALGNRLEALNETDAVPEEIRGDISKIIGETRYRNDDKDQGLSWYQDKLNSKAGAIKTVLNANIIADKFVETGDYEYVRQMRSQIALIGNVYSQDPRARDFDTMKEVDADGNPTADALAAKEFREEALKRSMDSKLFLIGNMMDKARSGGMNEQEVTAMGVAIISAEEETLIAALEDEETINRIGAENINYIVQSIYETAKNADRAQEAMDKLESNIGKLGYTGKGGGRGRSGGKGYRRAYSGFRNLSGYYGKSPVEGSEIILDGLPKVKALATKLLGKFKKSSKVSRPKFKTNMSQKQFSKLYKQARYESILSDSIVTKELTKQKPKFKVKIKQTSKVKSTDILPSPDPITGFEELEVGEFEELA